MLCHMLTSTLLKLVMAHFSVLQIVSCKLLFYSSFPRICAIFDVIDELPNRMETTEEEGSRAVNDGLK